VDQRRYLYHARITSRLSLQQIGVRTALSPSVLRNLDEGRFELLPSGVYARSYVRTFAAAVGLDPEAALAELEHLLPGAPDPLPALNARRPADWPVQLARKCVAAASHRLRTCKVSMTDGLARVTQSINAAVQHVDPGTCVDSVRQLKVSRILRSTPRIERAEHWVRACREASGAAIERARKFSENDLTDRLLARAGLLLGRMTSSPTVDTMRQSVARLQNWPGLTRFSAAAIDALLLMVVDAFLVYLISWSSGIPASLLLRDAGSALGAFCAIPIALYFLLFGGIAGSTLGGYICSLLPSLSPATGDDHDRHHPLTLHDILRRAVRG
jgi:helix-turn-helix protein